MEEKALAEAQLAAENRVLHERLASQKGRDIKQLDDEVEHARRAAAQRAVVEKQHVQVVPTIDLLPCSRRAGLAESELRALSFRMCNRPASHLAARTCFSCCVESSA